MFVRASVNDEAGAVEVVGPSNAIYVDVAGVNATGQRGNAAFPFLTLEAASGVAVSGDEILISPGTFSSTGKPWTTPPVANLTVRGSGELAGGTILTTDVNTDAVSINGAARSLLIEDLRIVTTGTGRAIVGDGTGQAGAYLTNALKLENVDILTGGATRDSINVQFANEIVLVNVQASTPSASFITCSNIRLRGNTTLGDIVHTWDNASVQKPAAQTVGMNISAGCTIGSWTGTGQPLVFGAVGSTIGLGIGTSMTGNNLSVSTIAPSIQIHGTVGAVDFASTGAKSLPDGAVAATVVDFSGATLIGTTYQFADAANVTNQAVNFTGVRTSAAVTLTSGLRCKMDERGSNFAVQPTYVSAGATLGTHLPSKLIVLGTAAIADTTIAFGFTADNTNYMVFGLETAAAGTPVTQGAKNATNTHIAIGGAPAGTIDACIMWI